MEDYKKRMITEYKELKGRTSKLRTMLNKWNNGTLNFTPTCPKWLLEKQLETMEDYLLILKMRAMIEDVDLFDYEAYKEHLTQYYCNHDCDALYEAYQRGREDALKK